MKLINCCFFLYICNLTSCNIQDQDIIYAVIFIHGTTRPYLNLQNIVTIWKQHGMERSSYATITKYMRNAPLWKKYQAMQGLGLEKINLKEIKDNGTYGAIAIANIYDYFSKSIYPKRKIKYFTFGWSGMLGSKARKLAAKKLYRSIIKLQRAANIKNKKLYLILIGYSHGATAALNLGKIKRKQKIKINELLTLGMPVQYDSDHLINSPIFENIYHFYSLSDYVQPIDHFSSKYFACHRRFIARKGFRLPKKLKQIRLQVTKTTFTKDPEEKCDNNKRILKTYHLNPGHGELWGLAWNPNGYRKDFALYPIPIVTITPLLTYYIDCMKQCAQHLSADIKPGLNEVEISEHIYKKIITKSFDFIHIDEFEELKKVVLEKFKPKNSLVDEYAKTLHEAINYTNRIHNLCDFNGCKDFSKSQ